MSHCKGFIWNLLHGFTLWSCVTQFCWTPCFLLVVPPEWVRDSPHLHRQCEEHGWFLPVLGVKLKMEGDVHRSKASRTLQEWLNALQVATGLSLQPGDTQWPWARWTFAAQPLLRGFVTRGSRRLKEISKYSPVCLSSVPARYSNINGKPQGFL